MRAIPGRDGIPMKYFIWKNDLPDLTPNNDFLDDYVNNSELKGNLLLLMRERYIHSLSTF